MPSALPPRPKSEPRMPSRSSSWNGRGRRRSIPLTATSTNSTDFAESLSRPAGKPFVRGLQRGGRDVPFEVLGRRESHRIEARQANPPVSLGEERHDHRAEDDRRNSQEQGPRAPIRGSGNDDADGRG